MKRPRRAWVAECAGKESLVEVRRRTSPVARRLEESRRVSGRRAIARIHRSGAVPRAYTVLKRHHFAPGRYGQTSDRYESPFPISESKRRRVHGGWSSPRALARGGVPPCPHRQALPANAALSLGTAAHDDRPRGGHSGAVAPLAARRPVRRIRWRGRAVLGCPACAGPTGGERRGSRRRGTHPLRAGERPAATVSRGPGPRPARRTPRAARHSSRGSGGRSRTGSRTRPARPPRPPSRRAPGGGPPPAPAAAPG